LDPFATGLLVLLSGAATRLVPCFVGLDKRYVTDVDLTSTTTTGDPEGDVVERHSPPSRATLDEALERLRGEIELPVPAASAVKIGGERAYRLARRGVEVDMPLRRSQVHALDVIAYTGDAPSGGTTVSAADAVAAVRLELHVSSGTYIRSIAHALGGHCTTLRRVAVGDFGVDEAAPVEEAALLSVGAALERLPPEAREKVPESVRAGVLALDAPVGDGSAA
jgi:tRNA pseudouridine55 synthase